MKKTLTKEFEFCYAHKLIDKSLGSDENKKLYGKCYLDTHGHNCKMIITVSGEEKNGMIINFVDLKKIVNENIIEKFDHRNLNNLGWFDDKVATCENFIIIIWDILERVLEKQKITLEEIKLYETDTSYCTLTKDDVKIKRCETCGETLGFSEYCLWHFKKLRYFCNGECLKKFVNRVDEK